MDLGQILSLGASLFNASRSGSGGGSTGGGSWLSNLFSSPSTSTGTPSAGGGTDWGAILSAIGQTAGQFKATPREGASRKDIEKANRFNLLTGLLGGGAQIAGGLMSQQRQGEAYNALADILSGKDTTLGTPIPSEEGQAVGAMPTVTTEAPISQANKIRSLGTLYPDLAPKFMDIAGTMEQNQQKAYLEELKAAQKGLMSPQDRKARAEYYKAIGEPPEAIPALIQQDVESETAQKQAAQDVVRQKYGISPALRGLAGIESMPNPNQIYQKLPIVIPERGIKEAPQEAFQKLPIVIPESGLKQGSPEETYQKMGEAKAASIDSQRFPEMYREQAAEAERLMGEGEPKAATATQAPMLRGEAPTPSPTLTQFDEDTELQKLQAQQESLINKKQSIDSKPNKSIEDYREQARIRTDLQAVENRIPQLRDARDKKYAAVREEINRVSTPYAKVLSKGARANDLYETVKTQLRQGTKLGDESAIKTLIQAIDDSVVHPSEQQAAIASLLSKKEQLIRLGQSYLGITNPLKGNIKNQLLKLADDIRTVSLNSYRRAEDAITNVAIQRVKGNFNARLSDYDQQYTTIGALVGGSQQQPLNIRGLTAQPQSPLAGLGSPIATPTASPRRIVSVEPYNP